MAAVAFEELVSVSKAAEILGIDRSLVARYVKDGRLRGERVDGARAYSVHLDSVTEFASNRPKRGNPNFGPKFWKKKRNRD